MGRCGQVDDELGSRLVAARLIRDLMRLCFLMEQQYAPYIKWFSTAFAQLGCATKLMPIFNHILNATQWQQREKPLTQAYSIVANMHNALGITQPLPTKVSPFHDRPFLVIHAENFDAAIYQSITSEEVLSLPRNLGGVDQFVDSTDVLDYPRRYDQLKIMYQGDATWNVTKIRT